MVRHKCAPTNRARPRWFAFSELLSLLLQNSPEAITNANKKHGLRPVLEVYTLTDRWRDGPCSTQITVTGRWAGAEAPRSRKSGKCTWSHVNTRDSPHCKGASWRCSRTSWLRTPSTLASPWRFRDGWAQLGKKVGDSHGGHWWQLHGAQEGTKTYTETHTVLTSSRVTVNLVGVGS